MFKSKPSNSILRITAKRRNPKERACKAKKVKKVPVLKHRLTKKKSHGFYYNSQKIASSTDGQPPFNVLIY